MDCLIRKLNDNLLVGTLPEFLQYFPECACTYDLQNNYFDCPLPLWCSAQGNGQCEPCYNYTISFSGSPSPSPSVSMSATLSVSQSIITTDSSDSGRIDATLVIVFVILTFCVCLILVAGVAALFIKSTNKSVQHQYIESETQPIFNIHVEQDSSNTLQNFADD
jgi:hypothetical protein